MRGCRQIDMHTRSSALQALDQWMTLMVADEKSMVWQEDILNQIHDVVMVNWEHPAKKVSHRIASIFNQSLRVQDSILGRAASLERTKALFRTILHQPIERKSAYIALQLLVPKDRMGALDMLRTFPGLVERIFSAIVADAEVTSWALALLLPLMRNLKAELGNDDKMEVHVAPTARCIAHLGGCENEAAHNDLYTSRDAQDRWRHCTASSRMDTLNRSWKAQASYPDPGCRRRKADWCQNLSRFSRI